VAWGGRIETICDSFVKNLLEEEDRLVWGLMGKEFQVLPIYNISQLNGVWSELKHLLLISEKIQLIEKIVGLTRRLT
jgi:hypothetical protein